MSRESFAEQWKEYMAAHAAAEVALRARMAWAVGFVAAVCVFVVVVLSVVV